MLSVILPCRNAAADLREQLDALEGQRTVEDFEVVVVDNGSTDDTAAIAISYADRLPNLRVVDGSARAGRHYACNAGARHARGVSLVFVDADDIVDHLYVDVMARALRQHELVAPRLDHSEINAGAAATLAFQTSGLEPSSFLPSAAGSGLGITAAAFASLGGFDETMDFGEDVDLCWRAQLGGFTIHFEPQAVVHYRQRPNARAMFSQHRAYGEATVLLFVKFRELGMPRRTVRQAGGEWLAVLRALPFLRDPDVRVRWIRRTARAVGRLRGCIRHRVVYF